jgi:hypothetical protein
MSTMSRRRSVSDNPFALFVSGLTTCLVEKYDRMVATEFQIEVLGANEPPRPQPVRGT